MTSTTDESPSQQDIRDGGPDDRAWQRAAVLEMTRRATTALSRLTKEI